MAIRITIILSLSLFTTYTKAKDLITQPDVPSPESVQAYKQYWKNFDDYERGIIKKGKQKYQNSWLNIQEEKEKHEILYNKKELEHLENASLEYREHLEDHEFAQNLPYVYLNLAQILIKIGNLKTRIGEDGTSHKQEALAILEELESRFKDFSEREATLYQKGLIYADLGADKQAVRIWERLSRIATASLYGVHARIAAGDYLFKIERSDDALKYYKAALDLLSKVSAKDPDYEKLRIQYRIIWAAYRSAKLKDTIDVGLQILRPGRHNKKNQTRKKVEEDAIQLIGDSLYENNDPRYTKSILKQHIINDYSSKISMRIIQNYLANQIWDEIIDIGEYSLNLHPVASSAPDILIMVSDAYLKSGLKAKQVKTLERLALFLPNQSLWRSRNNDDFHLTKSMEKKARGSAVITAEYHYEQGMSTGNPQYFEAAASFYNLLLKFEPNSSDSHDFRLKRGHSYYFSEQYEKAENQYKELIKELNVGHKILKVASYQIIMTREKIWRKSFAEIDRKGDQPKKHPIVVDHLRKLENSIEDFANRFPPKMMNNQHELAIDALLLGAAANRDHKNYPQAEKIWNRVLLANPTRGQRIIAIRGLVLSKVESGKPKDIVEIARRYLRLENWDKVGLSIGHELEGILSQATIDYSAALNEKGQFAEAGHLGVDTAKEFPRLPRRAKIFRDGAYMLAIAGLWREAEQASNEFLDQNITTNRSDMLYLKARSQEYQMRFGDASANYFELASQYPNHPKAKVAIKKAEQLAEGESEYNLAGQSAILGSKLSRSREAKIASLERAHHHFKEAEDFETSLKAAEDRLSISKGLNQKLPARVAVANALMLVRSEDEALERYKKISQSANSNRSRIDQKTYSSVYGEANFHLAQEAKDALHDFKILEREGNLRQTVNQKMRYFETMVNYYNLAAKSGSVAWASKSRFMIGLESDNMADILIRTIKILEPGESIKIDISKHAERLRKLARTQYSANLLAKSRNPKAYKNNPWVKKSKLKLGGYLKSKGDFKSEDFGPSAVSLNIPQQWSL